MHTCTFVSLIEPKYSSPVRMSKAMSVEALAGVLSTCGSTQPGVRMIKGRE